MPAAALVRRPEFDAVYVVDATGRAQLRQVRLGRQSGDTSRSWPGCSRAIASPPTAVAAAGNDDDDPPPQRALGVSGRIARYFQSAQITPLLALIALLLGVFAVLVTPREEEPQINVTMANVLIPFPGASAKDVESMVAAPAEQVISRIANVEHVMSVSRPGLAVITVQFKVGVPRITALVSLYDTILSNQDWLPRNLGTLQPIVKPKGIDDVPIVTLALFVEGRRPSGPPTWSASRTRSRPT